MDRLIEAAARLAAEREFPATNPTTAERIAIAAVGGYGRGAMAPQSDVHLLFPRPYKQTPRVEQTVEYVLYLLRNMGLKLRNATRSCEECIRPAKDDDPIQ